MSCFRVAMCAVLLQLGLIGAAQTVIRVAPPPPVRGGVVGVAPGRGYVYVPGYQRWNGSRYVWMTGVWVRPPRPGAIWVQPRYVHRGNTWVFYKGYWR
ncbi:MAG: hypothetical protein WB608_04095 [Terracidiphilus sp.]